MDGERRPVDTGNPVEIDTSQQRRWLEGGITSDEYFDDAWKDAHREALEEIEQELTQAN